MRQENRPPGARQGDGSLGARIFSNTILPTGIEFIGGMIMKRQIENAKYTISEALELPIDIMMDLPKLTVIGNIEASLLNHKGIIEYTQETIRINTKSGVFKITGEGLQIKTILSEEIIIVGLIENIEIIS